MYVWCVFFMYVWCVFLMYIWCFLFIYMWCFLFSQACSLDPLLDDSVMFAKKLKRRNKHVQLDIIDGLPHGFLNFSPISTECKAASMRCVRHIMQVLYGFQGEELFDSEDDH